MKVLGNKVLLEQIGTEKAAHLILPDNARDVDRFNFSPTKIIQLGPDVDTEIFKVNDYPVLHSHVQIIGTKVVEKTKSFMKVHLIVEDIDIIAIDNELAEEVKEKTNFEQEL